MATFVPQSQSSMFRNQQINQLSGGTGHDNYAENVQFFQQQKGVSPSQQFNQLLQKLLQQIDQFPRIPSVDVSTSPQSNLNAALLNSTNPQQTIPNYQGNNSPDAQIQQRMQELENNRKFGLTENMSVGERIDVEARMPSTGSFGDKLATEAHAEGSRMAAKGLTGGSTGTHADYLAKVAAGYKNPNYTIEDTQAVLNEWGITKPLTVDRRGIWIGNEKINLGVNVPSGTPIPGEPRPPKAIESIPFRANRERSEFEPSWVRNSMENVALSPSVDMPYNFQQNPAAPDRGAAWHYPDMQSGFPNNIMK